MVGTGYLDFDPIVVEVAVLHLKKHELACEVGDGKRFISNRIKQADWAAIELLKESAATIATIARKLKPRSLHLPIPTASITTPLAITFQNRP